MLTKQVLTRALLTLVLALLLIPVIVIVTNDSFSYLGQAVSGSIQWPVSFGFKQAGYSLYLWSLNEFSTLIVADIFQVHYAFGLIILSLTIGFVPIKEWWLWLAFLLFSLSLVMNIVPAILPEHLLVLLCLGNASVTLCMLSQNGRRDWFTLVMGLLTTIAIIEVKASAGLMTVPFICLAAIICIKELTLKKFAATVLCVIFGSAALLQIGFASYKNLDEYGSFTPVINTERIKIWGLEYSIRSAGKISKLSHLYQGSIYSIIHPMEKQYEYPERKIIFEETMDRMRDASGLTHQDIFLQQLDDAIFSPLKMNDIRGSFRQALKERSGHLVSVQASRGIDQLPGVSKETDSKHNLMILQNYLVGVTPIFVISVVVFGIVFGRGQLRVVLILYLLCSIFSLYIHANSYLCNFRYLVVLWVNGLAFAFYTLSMVWQKSARNLLENRLFP